MFGFGFLFLFSIIHHSSTPESDNKVEGKAYKNLLEGYEVVKKPYDYIDDREVQEVRGKLLYKAEERDKEFYVWGGQESKRYSSVGQPFVLNSSLGFISPYSPLKGGKIILDGKRFKNYSNVSTAISFNNSVAFVVDKQRGESQVVYKGEKSPLFDQIFEIREIDGKIFYRGVLADKNKYLLRFGEKKTDKYVISDYNTIGDRMLYQYKGKDLIPRWRFLEGPKVHKNASWFYDVNGTLGYFSYEDGSIRAKEFVYGNNRINLGGSRVDQLKIKEGKVMIEVVGGSVKTMDFNHSGAFPENLSYLDVEESYILTSDQRFGPYEGASDIGYFNDSIVYRAKEGNQTYFYIDGKRKRKVPENVMSKIYDENVLAYESLKNGKHQMIVNGQAGNLVVDVTGAREIGGEAVYIEHLESGRIRLIKGMETVANLKDITALLEVKESLVAIIKGKDNYYILRPKN